MQLGGGVEAWTLPGYGNHRVGLSKRRPQTLFEPNALTRHPSLVKRPGS
jgi:hypothetical protein